MFKVTFIAGLIALGMPIVPYNSRLRTVVSSGGGGGGCAISASQLTQNDYHASPLQGPISQKIRNSDLAGKSICQVDLFMEDGGGGSSAIHVILNSAKDGTGTTYGTSTTYLVTAILNPAGGAWSTMLFTIPVANPGADFWIVLVSEDANNCRWRSVDPDAYAGASYFAFRNGSDDPTEDFTFRLYGQ